MITSAQGYERADASGCKDLSLGEPADYLARRVVEIYRWFHKRMKV